MKILAVNTANTLLSLALVDGDKVLHLYESTETRDQGNLLLKHVQEALEKSKLSYADLNLLAVVTGPGSFTGIRIGLATMRAMAMAAHVPIVGLSSFELFSAPKAGYSNIVAVESWREELYFQLDNHTPVNVSPEDFVKTLPAGKYVISGDAADKLKPLLPDAVLHDAKVNAVDAARVAAKKFATNAKPDRPVPFYLREADVTMAKS